MKQNAGCKLPINGRSLEAILCVGLMAWMLCAASAYAAEQVQNHRPPIVSAAEIDYPPFSIVDAEGRPGGFSVELMRAALSAMGRDVVFRTGPWAEVRG